MRISDQESARRLSQGVLRARDGGLRQALVMRRLLAGYEVALLLVLAACVGFFIEQTWPWPLVGDASLMHYVVFLMQHGMAPYREIVDYNMPGAYLVEGAVMYLLGSGALAWRIFDFALLAAGAGAMAAIAGKHDRFAAAFAASLLVLIHGRDGVAQGGQRDLTVAVLQLAACAFLFDAVRRERAWATAVFGLLAGFAVTVKPTTAPFGPVLLLLAGIALARRGRPLAFHVLAGVAGMLAPGLGMLLWLWQTHSFAAFMELINGLAPYHASIGRLPPHALLLHCIPSALQPLLAVWLVIALARREWRSFERAALIAGAALGVVSFYLQGKGFPYHHYPSEAFLLLLAGLSFSGALQDWAERTPGLPVRVLAALALVGMSFGALVIAPVSAVRAAGYEWRNEEFATDLQEDLQALGGARLSGNVQCLDTFAGCINVLYRMQLVQSTGFIYDCYLFAPRQSSVQQQYRERFWASLQSRPPKVLVVTNQLCFEDTRSYDKLRAWPEFNSYLAANYKLYAERVPPHLVRWWSHEVTPFGYRIYLAKEAMQRNPGLAPVFTESDVERLR